MARIWDETGAQRRIDIWDWKDALQKIGITLKDGAEEYIEQHCREEVSDAKVIQREKYNGTCLKEQFRLAGLGVAV